MQNKSIGHSLWSCNKVYIPPRQEKEEKKFNMYYSFCVCKYVMYI